jgi:hypothetical protein
MSDRDPPRKASFRGETIMTVSIEHLVANARGLRGD